MHWYQVKARLERVQDNGSPKIVSENYLVQALSFGLAEDAIRKEIAPSGEFDIVSVARKNYSEIIHSKLDEEISDRWYKCKINFTTINHRNGRESKASSYYLVQASSALTAHRAVDDFMIGAVSDYEVEQVDETKILEVFKISSSDNQ